MAEEEQITLGSVQQDWQALQDKVFTRWCNVHLSKRGLKLTGLLDGGLDDGIMLYNLLEILSEKNLPSGLDKKPKMRIQNASNLSLCFQFLDSEKIKTVGIGPEDIMDRKQQLVLGLIWTLIMKYLISLHSGSGSDPQAELIRWINEKGVPCTNLTHDWKDGKNLCLLANALKPGMFTEEEIQSKSPFQLCFMALKRCERDLGVPPVLDPGDMIQAEPDALANMTYLSLFRNVEPRQGTPLSAPAPAGVPLVSAPEANPQLVSSDMKSIRVATLDTFGIINLQGCNPRDVTVAVTDPDRQPVTQVSVTPNANGTISLSGLSNKAGKHNAKLFVSGKPVPGAPLQFQVLPNPTAIALPTGNEPAYVGVPWIISNFHDLKGAEPNDLKLLVHRLNDPNHPVASDIETNPHGFTAKFTAPEVGTYVASLTANGIPVTDPLHAAYVIPATHIVVQKKPEAPKPAPTPVAHQPEPVQHAPVQAPIQVQKAPVIVQQAPPEPIMVSAHPSLTQGVLGPIISVNTASAPKDLYLLITGPNGSPVDSKQTRPNATGGFDILFQPTQAGPHKALIYQDGKQVPDTPEIPFQVLPAQAPSPQIKVSMQNPVTPQESHKPQEPIRVSAYSTLNEGTLSPLVSVQTPSAPKDIYLRISTPNGAALDAKQTKPNSVGGFDILYQPNQLGPHVAKLFQDGKQVPDTPEIRFDVVSSGVKLVVESGQPQPTQATQAPQPSHQAHHAGAKAPQHADSAPQKNVQPQQTYSSPSHHSSAPVSGQGPAAVMDGQRAVYQITPLPAQYANRGDLTVKLTGPATVPGALKFLPNGQLSIQFTPPVPGTYNATIYSDNNPIAGPIPILVQLPKANLDGQNNASSGLGNELAKFPIHELTVKLTGPAEVAGKVTTVDGGLGISFVPPMTGVYQAMVFHHGQPVLTKPHEILVSPQGLRQQKIPNELHSVGGLGLVLQLQPLEDGSGLKLNYSNNDVRCEVTDKNGRIQPNYGFIERGPNGEVHITLTPTEPGEYRAQIYVYDQPILVDPLRATCSDFNANALKRKNPVAPSELKNIQTKNGRPLGLQYSPSELTVQVTSPSGQTIPGNLNAHWILSFNTPESGQYKAQFFHNGSPVLTSPYSFNVVAGFPRKQAIAVGQTLEVGAGGLNVNLEPLTDSFDVPLHCSPSDLVVEMTHANGTKQKGSASALPGGVIQVAFHPSVVGNYTAQIYLQGHAILESPLHFICTEPYVSKEQKTAAAPTPSGGTVREQTNYSTGADAIKQASIPVATPKNSISSTQTMKLNELLQRARDCAVGAEVHDLNGKKYDLPTFQKKVIGSIQALAPLYKTSWQDLMSYSFDKRFEFFESLAEAFTEYWTELKTNFGLFVDQKFQNSVIDSFVAVTNDLIENVNLLKEIVTSPANLLPQLEYRYINYQKNSQHNNNQLVTDLKRYLPRANTYSSILGMHLNGAPSTISNAIAAWYNSQQATLATLEQDLGVRLPAKVSDSVSYFTTMIKDLLDEAKNEEPDFGKLIRSMLQILMFVRLYAVAKLSGDPLNTCIVALNDMSQSFVLLSAAKLKYAHSESNNHVAALMPHLKTISACLKSAP